MFRYLLLSLSLLTSTVHIHSEETSLLRYPIVECSSPPGPNQECSSRKVALIFGVTGQDGAYLSEFLLEKGYEVHGVIRRSSSFNTGRLSHLYQDPHTKNVLFHLHYGDLTDSGNIIGLIRNIAPDEIYNLGAQSHVHVSFELPEYTTDVDGLGALRILEAIHILGLEHKTKFYQASTSELFGLVQETPQSETTPFYPRSPYATAKLFAYWITVNYRESYGIFTCNGILFNHESPLRGRTFVTRKITEAACKISEGKQDILFLGNIDAIRDWGFAKDYVEAMWLMLQQDQPDDYVVATGEAHTVREFAEIAFREVGINLDWRGDGVDEIGYNRDTGDAVIKIDSHYYRPNEVELLIGDRSKIEKKLHWKPTISFEELVQMMVQSDMEELKGNNYKC